MRKHLLSLMAASVAMLAATGVVSCSTDPDIDTISRIEVVSEPFSVEGAGGEVTFDVQSNAYWNVSFVDDEGELVRWITADVPNGTGDATVTLTVARNTSIAERTANVVVTTESQSDSMIIPLAQGSGGIYAITPSAEFFLADPTKLSAPNDAVIGSTLDVATKTVTFDSGNTIRQVGGAGGTCYTAVTGKQLYNGRFVTTGWGGDDWQATAYIVKLKALSALKGELRFGFGLVATSGNTPKTWDVRWSADGVSWNTGSEVAATPYDESDYDTTFPLQNKNNFKISRFTIPNNKTIPAGSYIYLRIAPTSNESRTAGGTVDPLAEIVFFHGLYLMTNELRAYHTSDLPTGAKVVLTEGFDELSHGHDYFLPARHFLSNVHLSYTGSNGWTATGATECPGYLMMGAASAPKAGTLTSPALTAIGDTPANITVSFKAAFFLPASYPTSEAKTLAVSTSGGGTVVGSLDFSSIPEVVGATVEQMTATDAAYYKWYNYSIKVTGATKTTKLVFKTTTGRHFIDEIVVTKD